MSGTIQNTRDIGLLDAIEVIHLAEEAGLIALYHDLRSNAQDSLILRPQGIHGVLHALRVLLLVIILSDQMSLKYEQRDTLAFCALFHDIGRTNDGEDETHGELSIVKIMNHTLWDSFARKYHLDMKCWSYAKAIIHNHCISDDQGIRDIQMTKDIPNKQEAIDLYLIFKDADGLDRVRLHDLDTDYLRSLSAKRLPLVAHYLLNYLK